MVTIGEAKTQTQQARQVLQSKQQQVQTATERLSQLKQSLPKSETQRALRQKLSGLKGREQRRTIEKAKSEIGKREVLVKEYSKELKRFETEQLAPVESEIKHIEIQQAAYKTAVQYAREERPLAAVHGEEYKYLKEIYKGKLAAQESFEKMVLEARQSLPRGDKLVVDYKNLRIKGIESETLGQTLSVTDYNKRLQDLNKQFQDIPEVKDVLIDQSRLGLDQRDIDSISKIQDVKKMKFEMFPMVSAAPITPAAAQDLVVPSRIEKAKEKAYTFIKTKVADPFGKAHFKLMGVEYTPETVAQRKAYLKSTGVQRDVSVLLMGGLSTPRALVSTLTVIPETRLLGTIEKGQKVSKVTVLGETTQKGYKPTYDIATQFQTKGLSLSKGVRFEVSRTLKIPKGIDVKPIKVQPYIDISKVKQLGKAKVIKEVKGIKVVKETRARSYLTGEDTIMVVEKIGTAERPVYSVLGGKPSAVRIYKEGGISYIIKKPTIKGKIYPVVEEGTGVKFMQPAQIKKTPLLKTFPVEEEAIVKTITPIVRGLKTEKVLVSDGTVTLLSRSILGVSGKQYTGTIIGDTTDVSRGYTQTLFGKEFVQAKPTITGDIIKEPTPTQKPIQLLDISPKQRQELVQLPTLEQQQKVSQLPKQEFVTIQKQRQPAKQFVKTLLGLKQPTKQVQRPITSTPRQIIKPKKPIPIKLFPTPSAKEKVKKEAKEVLDSFKVFTRKKGVDIEVGEFETLGEAKTKLKGTLIETLRASGFVTKKGKKVRLDFGFGFRPSKVDPFRIVQRKERRFGTRGEIREAQFFKKAKGGSKFL